uniref:mitogen-activated protein kinase kinase n=1 Tax=Albugo laibachii Nc14 TaxID=890382 RepID=F0W168_9STRA|nr:dual specificity mitogenactivated protein kinase kinase putative [Albugo laibachii Nc14]|eukprot:CCA14793.1 dual specificity mitogenactivated protein kinase kinase putative [Albugo laibachii Nc14]
MLPDTSMQSSISVTSSTENASVNDNRNHGTTSRSSPLSKSYIHKSKPSLETTQTSPVNQSKSTHFSNDIKEAKDNAKPTNLQSSPFNATKQNVFTVSKELKRSNYTMLSADDPVITMRSRSLSAPNLCPLTPEDVAMVNIFPDVNPRDLRIKEVKMWRSDWMEKKQISISALDYVDAFEATIQAYSNELLEGIDEKAELKISKEVRDNRKNSLGHHKIHVDSPPKRPQLRLKLENMPTSQQAEQRAQKAANRLIFERKAIQDMQIAGQADDEIKPAAQQAMMKMTLRSYSSGGDSDLPSPNGSEGRQSAYSPNHGMFTTESVAISEAGISSPDSACLHLQENLERVLEIGRGASGIVYKAIHVPTLKVIAVKEVSVYGRGQRKQMVRELHALHSNLVPINTSACIDARPRPSEASPHIVSFYDAFVDRPKNCIGLVMEYMGAGSLQDIVLRGGCQSEKVLVRLAVGVLRGLSHIHKKRMVHRDIKPHNLLANRRGEVKISDFGLATTLNENVTKMKSFVGTLLYMAPERIGGGDYSYPADIWSFGLAFVSVALGKYPLSTQDGFFGLVDSVANEQFLELPSDQFSQECREFARQCLQIDPEKRPSAEELLAHPFLQLFTDDETLLEWNRFVDSHSLCEDRDVEVHSLAEAVYRHIYERCVKFSYQPHSEYDLSFRTQRCVSYGSKNVASIPPVEKSLQIGLSSYLGLPVEYVYEVFEKQRLHFGQKLALDYCFSPQSWTKSTISSHSRFSLNPLWRHRGTQGAVPTSSTSIWQKLQASFGKIGRKHKNSSNRG